MSSARADDPDELTRLLARARAGESGAAEDLYARVYDHLRAMASGQMAGLGEAHTLQPTALVHEAWLRLSKAPGIDGWRDREHFLCYAARAMRSVLIDHARRRKTDKRGGEWQRQPLDAIVELYQGRGIDLLALDDALERLAADEPRQARVVVLRTFGGLTLPEVARQVGVSLATAERDWHVARMFLRETLREMEG